MALIFDDGKDFYGTLDYGYEAGWHWSKNRGSYWNGRDFFWTHWEVKSGNVCQVRWHVEAPSATVEATLNQIKQEMVTDFLAPRFQNLIEQNGLEYLKGTRAQLHHIEKNRCTEPFRVQLLATQNSGSAQGSMKIVNALMREPINNVLQRYKSRLDEHFNN